MKNITLSVPDEVYRQARITAAERGTSVSEMVRDLLRQLTKASDPAREEKLNAFFASLDKGRNTQAVGDLRREEIHDRPLLHRH
jgi:plasmid stability protein